MYMCNSGRCFYSIIDTVAAADNIDCNNNNNDDGGGYCGCFMMGMLVDFDDDDDVVDDVGGCDNGS